MSSAKQTCESGGIFGGFAAAILNCKAANNAGEEKIKTNGKMKIIYLLRRVQLFLSFMGFFQKMSTVL